MVKHMRRPMVNRSECDDEDPREFAFDPSEVTCPACLAARGRREKEWHDELKARPRPPRDDDK